MKEYIEKFAKKMKEIAQRVQCDKCAMMSNGGICTFKGSEKDKNKICNEILNKKVSVHYE